MKRWILLLFLLYALTSPAQNGYNYTYTDPCTLVTQNVFVPSNGGVSVNYFGNVRVFSSNDFSSGVFDSWITQVTQANSSNPCQSVTTTIVNNISSNIISNVVTVLSNVVAITSVVDISSTAELAGTFAPTVESISNTNTQKEEKNKNNTKSNNQTTTQQQSTGISISGNGNSINQNQPNGTNQSTTNTGTASASVSPTAKDPGGNQTPTNIQGSQTTTSTNGSTTSSTNGSTTQQGGNTTSTNQPTQNGSTTTQSSVNQNINTPNSSTTSTTSGSTTTTTTTTNPTNPTAPTSTASSNQSSDSNIANSIVNVADASGGGGGTESNKSSASLIASGDVIAISNTDQTQNFRFVGSITHANTKGTRIKGVLFNFTSGVNNLNGTLYKSWINKSRKSNLVLANSFMMDFDKNFFNTVTGLESYKFNKKYTGMLGLNFTAGVMGERSFINLSGLVGGLASFKVNNKVNTSILILSVYSPFTQFYAGTWWKSGLLIVPFSSWDIKITKTFKYNISATGVYQLNDAFLNYQILTGGKLNF